MLDRGETVADLVSHDLGLGYVRASSLFVGGFVLLALAERRTAVPTAAARYWIAIVLMSTTGTALADLFMRTLGLGYAGTSLALTALFLLVVAGWPRLRRLRAVRRADAADPVLPHAHVRLEHTELPDTDAGYWAAIMVASTLGTSLGDFVSNALDLGFAGGTVLLGSVLASVLATEHLATQASTARYWTALITASTIGATSGDYLTKEDGLGFASPVVIATQLAVLLVLLLLADRLARRAHQTASVD